MQSFTKIKPSRKFLNIQYGEKYNCALIEEFPIIGFYLYHVTSAGQSSNWTTSGIKKHILRRVQQFEHSAERLSVLSLH